MDIVNSIMGIGASMIDPLKVCCGYLKHYDDNIVALKNQLKTLENMEKDVNVAIDAANRNNQEIRKIVQHWITSVEEVKMKDIKFLEDNEKVNMICFRGWFPNLKTRYSQSKEAVSKSKMTKKLCEDGAIFGINVSLPAPPPGIDSTSSKDIRLFHTTELAMELVMDALKDESTYLVALYGMGGVGKTTLVKEIARKCIKEKIFDDDVMAVVSQNVNVEGIQEQIAEFLGLKLEEKSTIIRARRLLDRLTNILVILDDVWGELDLANIGIPSREDHKGCKVVITTRRRQVCTAMGVEATKIVSLDVLNRQESWDLFKKQVGDIIDSGTVKIEAEKVVKECGGLPIALVTVGKAMRGKDLEEWQVAGLELKKSRPINIEGMEENVFKCIKLSYDYLRDEESKACFLFCCLFPEDHNIEIERLVRYGVGMNTFKRDNKIQEARSRVNSTIKNLQGSSLLMASERGYIKMHDVVRDVAKTIAMDKYFVHDDKVLKRWPNELSMDEYNGVGISLMRNEIKKYPDAWECPNLEILLMHEYNIEQEMPEEVFKRMKMLRVLDQYLNFSIEDRSLEPSLSHLTNLRTLIIEGYRFGQTWIWGINALGELKMLEVVSFRRCRFREQLDALWKLENLRLLELVSCHNCSSLFNNTRTLAEDCNFPQLEELHVTESMSCGVAELIKYHPRLNVLTFCIADISDMISENIVFPHLDHFAITVGSSYEEGIVGNYLENILQLDGGYRRLNMALLNELSSGVNILSLRRVKGIINVLPCLLVNCDSLAFLKKLKVRECNELEFLINIGEESRTPWPTCFSCLEEVELYELQSFRGLCGMVLVDIPNSFVSLRELKICSCPKMSNIGVPLLRRMQQLEVLLIDSCEAVEHLVDLKEEVEDAVEKEEGILVNLRKMRLTCLVNLEQLWKGSIGLVSLRNLKIVEIRDCCKLRVLFHWPVAQRLEQLEELTIDDCEELEEIVGREIGEKATGLEAFRNLKTVEIWMCPKLRVLFRWHVAQRLEQLEELTIDDCEELEEIVERETGEEATGLEPFGSLKKVEIGDCPKLRVLFHWPVAKRLDQLEELTIDDCEELEEIVGRETGAEGVHKALFPKLQHLYMTELPKLVGFYTGHLRSSQSTPKLKTVRIGKVGESNNIHKSKDNVEIAVDGKNLDKVIKEQKGHLLRGR